MMSFSFVLLVILTHCPFIHASPPSVTLGPGQVCRCFPPGTPGVCEEGTNPKASGFPGIRQDKCKKKMSMRISLVADDFATLFSCGEVIGITPGPHQKTDIFYRGPCDDLVLWIKNDNEAPSGIAMLIDVKGKKYGTTDVTGRYRVSGTRPLYGIITFEPRAGFFNNPEDFCFANWEPAVFTDIHLEFGEVGRVYTELAAQGAFPIGYRPHKVPAGVYGLKIKLPFC